MRGIKVTYRKLWHILIDRQMKKKELKELAGLTAHQMLKLRKNQHVTTEILAKICKALDCEISDMLEFNWD